MVTKFDARKREFEYDKSKGMYVKKASVRLFYNKEGNYYNIG